MNVFLLIWGHTDGEYGHFLRGGELIFSTKENAEKYAKEILEKEYYMNYETIPEELLCDCDQMLSYYYIVEKEVK